MARRIAFALQNSTIREKEIFNTTQSLSHPPSVFTTTAYEEEEKKEKVVRRRYSKLAFFVTRVVKSKEDTDDASSIVSSDSSLSSVGMDITPSQDVIFDFENCEAVKTEEKKKKKAKKTNMFRKRKNNKNCAATTTCCEDNKSRHKATQRRYSRIAFSVQNVGSVQQKHKKKGRTTSGPRKSKK